MRRAAAPAWRISVPAWLLLALVGALLAALAGGAYWSVRCAQVENAAELAAEGGPK